MLLNSVSSRNEFFRAFFSIGLFFFENMKTCSLLTHPLELRVFTLTLASVFFTPTHPHVRRLEDWNSGRFNVIYKATYRLSDSASPEASSVARTAPWPAWCHNLTAMHQTPVFLWSLLRFSWLTSKSGFWFAVRWKFSHRSYISWMQQKKLSCCFFKIVCQLLEQVYLKCEIL